MDPTRVNEQEFRVAWPEHLQDAGGENNEVRTDEADGAAYGHRTRRGQFYKNKTTGQNSEFLEFREQRKRGNEARKQQYEENQRAKRHQLIQKAASLGLYIPNSQDISLNDLHVMIKEENRELYEERQRAREEREEEAYQRLCKQAESLNISSIPYGGSHDYRSLKDAIETKKLEVRKETELKLSEKRARLLKTAEDIGLRIYDQHMDLKQLADMVKTRKQQLFEERKSAEKQKHDELLATAEKFGLSSFETSNMNNKELWERIKSRKQELYEQRERQQEEYRAQLIRKAVNMGVLSGFMSDMEKIEISVLKNKINEKNQELFEERKKVQEEKELRRKEREREREERRLEHEARQREWEAGAAERAKRKAEREQEQREWRDTRAEREADRAKAKREYEERQIRWAERAREPKKKYYGHHSDYTHAGPKGDWCGGYVSPPEY
eukprot:scaffold3991_cov159-Ochromonas_danica.AAC.9